MRPIILPEYSEDRNTCVYSHLKLYIENTSLLRNSGELLILFQKPYQHISKDTIARWIKLALTEAGVDTNIFTAHSTRGAASSKLHTAGVPIDTILASASTFEKFYKRNIDKPEFENFALEILKSCKNTD